MARMLAVYIYSVCMHLVLPLRLDLSWRKIMKSRNNGKKPFVIATDRTLEGR